MEDKKKAPEAEPKKTEPSKEVVTNPPAPKQPPPKVEKPIFFSDYCGIKGVKGYSRPGFLHFINQPDRPRTINEWDAEYSRFRTTPV